MLVAFFDYNMKIFKKYIFPFLLFYVDLTAAIAVAVLFLHLNGYAPVALTDFQFVLVFLCSLLVTVVLTILLLNHDKNIKAVYSNISKQPLLMVCVGEGLYCTNSLIAPLFDGVLLGSLIVIFPLVLYVWKTMRDIKEVLS